VYIEDVKFVFKKTTYTKTNTLLITGKELVLKIDAVKYMSMFMSHQQNTAQNHNIKIANKCLENETKFKHLGMTLTTETQL